MTSKKSRLQGAFGSHRATLYPRQCQACLEAPYSTGLDAAFNWAMHKRAEQAENARRCLWQRLYAALLNSERVNLLGEAPTGELAYRQQVEVYPDHTAWVIQVGTEEVMAYKVYLRHYLFLRRQVGHAAANRWLAVFPYRNWLANYTLERKLEVTHVEPDRQSAESTA